MKEQTNLEKELELLGEEISKVLREEEEMELSESTQMSMVFALVLKASNYDVTKVAEYAKIFALFQTIWENKKLRKLVVQRMSSLSDFKFK